jgi:hypothetical protein
VLLRIAAKNAEDEGWGTRSKGGESMAILLGLLVVAFGALVWVLDWSVGGLNASTIGVILIVLGAMVVLASRLIFEKAAIDRSMTDEQRDWSTPLGPQEAPEHDLQDVRPRSPDHPPFP